MFIRIYGPSLMLLALLTASCVHKSTQRIVRPVKVTYIVTDSHAERSFPAEAEARRYSALTFRIAGMVDKIAVNEGSNVRRGELIAKIDDRDYRLAVSSTKASFRQASLQLERYKSLYSNQAISRQEYEIAQSTYENARAAYEKAENDLRDTRLVAPFDGNIERKYIEEFQMVTAGQKIVTITDPTLLQFRFTLPEAWAEALNRNVTWNISVESAGGTITYPARVLEVVQSSEDGLGVPVILEISDKTFDARKAGIMPGYACTVNMSYPAGDNAPAEVPIAAIYTEPVSQGRFLWRIDMQDSTAHKIPVVTGPLAGEHSITVTSGLSGGEYIVTAGVTMLSDGEKVTIIQDMEP